MTEQHIVLDTDYIENVMERVNDELRILSAEIFYVPIDVKISSMVDDETVTIKNIPFLYYNKMYYMIHKINENGTPHIVCPTLNHVNISRNTTRKQVDDIIIECYHFCTGTNLNDTPPEKHFGNQELIKTTLAMILPLQNPSNGYYRADNYIGLVNPEITLICRNCGKPITPDKSVIELVTCRCGVHVREVDVESINPNKYYIKTRNDSDYHTYDTVPENLEKYKYRVITPEEIQEALRSYELSVDTIFVGCGSAGSNIGTQLARTDLIDNGILIDYDTIEYKNLRNQIYARCNVGYNKANILSQIMDNCRDRYGYNSPYRYRTQAIQNINLDLYKAKYLFNCVDSLTARLYSAKNVKARYIIDTRYHGLECTIMLIDTENEDQMNYYIKGLEQAIQTFVKDASVPKDLFTPNNCYRWGKIRKIPSLRNKSYSMLKKYTDKFYNSIPLEEKERLLHLLDKERQTCNSPNIIDVYSVSAGIIVGALRELENNHKLFTHLELTTEHAIPQTMIVKE